MQARATYESEAQAPERIVEPPEVKVGLPLLGTARAFNADPVGFLEHCRRRYGDVFTLNLLIYKITFVMNVQAHAPFFAAGHDTLNLTEAVKHVMRSILGDPSEYPNLMAHDSWHHANVREGLMAPERLARFVDAIVAQLHVQLPTWADKGEIDLFAECSRLVNFVNIRALLGQDVLEAYGDELAAAYMEIEKNAFALECIALPRVPFPRQQRAHRARRKVKRILEEVVTQRAKSPGDDYISLWLSRPMPDGRMLPPHELAPHLVSLFFAAHTNTAGTLGWTLSFLMRHPEHLKRARQEQAAFIDSHGDGFDLQSLKELKWLDACHAETQRLRFTLMLFRQAMQPWSCGNFVVPAGRAVAVSPIIHHRDPALYTHPERFDPTRFAEAGERARLAKQRAFVDFGFGVHRCLGEAFARAVLKPTWSLLLRHYELKPVDLKAPEPEWANSLGTPFPKRPERVRVRVRHNVNRRVNGRAPEAQQA